MLVIVAIIQMLAVITTSIVVIVVIVILIMIILIVIIIIVIIVTQLRARARSSWDTSVAERPRPGSPPGPATPVHSETMAWQRRRVCGLSAWWPAFA